MPFPRVFLDANVLFAAAWTPDGLSALLIELGRARRIELLSSNQAVIEAKRNLEAKKPAALSRIAEFLERIVVGSEPDPQAIRRITPAELSAKDRPLLAAAIAAGATHFVTGDRRDFGPWMTQKAALPIRILTPRQFFDEVEPPAG